MLLLNDIFAKTWAQFPATGPRHPVGPFHCRRQRPVPIFSFLPRPIGALEPRLRSLGFDYTYDKTIYDLLTQRRFSRFTKDTMKLPGGDLQLTRIFWKITTNTHRFSPESGRGARRRTACPFTSRHAFSV